MSEAPQEHRIEGQAPRCPCGRRLAWRPLPWSGEKAMYCEDHPPTGSCANCGRLVGPPIMYQYSELVDGLCRDCHADIEYAMRLIPKLPTIELNGRKVLDLRRSMLEVVREACRHKAVPFVDILRVTKGGRERTYLYLFGRELWEEWKGWAGEQGYGNFREGYGGLYASRRKRR